MNYLKKYYKLIAAALVVLLVLAVVLGGTTVKTSGYSVDNVYNTTKELSSDKYMGRRLGTEENMRTVKYIEEQFKSIGLKPAGEDGTYLRTYSGIGKESNGVPVLEVMDKDGRVVKSYKYGVDFNETGRGLSRSGELSSRFSFVDNISSLKSGDFDGSREIAVIMGKEMGERQTEELYMSLKKAGVNALIKIVPDTYSNLGRIYASGVDSLQRTGYEMPTLSLSENAKADILKYSGLGYKIHMKATTDGKGVSITDVMGMIPGKSDDYLFITAHLDHVGTSVDGRIFPGALDNASGTAAMLEIARYIKSQDKKPDKTIIFAAFNGGEGGYIGAFNYVRHPIYPLYKTTVLNLDRIGAGNDTPLKASYVYSEISQSNDVDINPASKLMYQLKKLAQSLDIQYVEGDESSDHIPFNYYGVPAVTIGDEVNEKIYTPEDDINNISKENIDRDMKLIMKYISFFAFSNGGIVGNKLVLMDVGNFFKTQYPLIIIIAALLILLLIQLKRKGAKASGRRFRIPLMTIAFVMLVAGIISYFPIRYPYAPTASPTAALKLFLEGILSVFKAPILWPFYVLYISPGMIIYAIAKGRQLKWNYRGDGRELDMVFYMAMVLTVILSAAGSTMLFNKQAYYPVTPDFARAFLGKLILHIVIGAAAFLFWKLMSFETKVKNMAYRGLLTFALIFIVLISAFYMPITINKHVFNTYSNTINMNQDEDIHRTY